MRNKGLINGLRVIGGTTIALGVLAYLILLNQFSQPGVFSNEGNVEGAEAATAIGVAFYHVVVGILCFGVAQVLAEITRPAEVENSREEIGPANQVPAVTKRAKLRHILTSWQFLTVVVALVLILGCACYYWQWLVYYVISAYYKIRH